MTGLLRAVAIAAAASAYVSDANAATIVKSCTIWGSHIIGNDWCGAGTTATQFDGSLGKLKRVTVNSKLNANGMVGFIDYRVDPTVLMTTKMYVEVYGLAWFNADVLNFDLPNPSKSLTFVKDVGGANPVPPGQYPSYVWYWSLEDSGSLVIDDQARLDGFLATAQYRYELAAGGSWVDARVTQIDGPFDDSSMGFKHLYTADFVYEYTPAGAVPEPATWATMIVGFGLAGAGLRRGRTTAAHA